LQWSAAQPLEVETEFGDWYPNPFSQNVSEGIILKEDQQVVGKIEDINGRQVGEMSADCVRGFSQITLVPTEQLGRELSVGVYVITIMADGKAKKTKLVKG
jgi:hypothetical protein